ncbi:MAG TPA: endo alpha-1,4 polygalactosaminidase [Kofleriaceae bacterium]
MRWLILAILAACGTSPNAGGTTDASSATDGSAGTDRDAAPDLSGLPPVNAKADYQLGGAYPPAAGVTVVARDHLATANPDLYNICYINGFQIQPIDSSYWTSQQPDLILKNNGTPVIDTAWNEMLIDVSTPAKRAAVAMIVDAYIDACKSAGFDAVEIDNLDSYSRSQGLLVADDNVAAMALFSAHAHSDGLVIAQKNSTELVPRKAELGTDFAIAEECNRYGECQTYRDGYGDHVIVIEYRRQDFAAGCTAYPQLSIVLRDLNLVLPVDSTYVYDAC